MKLLNTKVDIDLLSRLFEEQFPRMSIGGFHNPNLIGDDDTDLEFVCNYDNYGNEPDDRDTDQEAWTWFFNKTSGEFYN